jgi:hypothetical protein
VSVRFSLLGGRSLALSCCGGLVVFFKKYFRPGVDSDSVVKFSQLILKEERNFFASEDKVDGY